VNVGENKKRRLNRALQRFAAMLIEEATDLSGLPKSKLAEAMGISDDQVRRYTRLPGMKNSRAPQAAAVQQLENRVAKLLKRTPHTVVVENLSHSTNRCSYYFERIVGRPGDDLNLRPFDLGSFQLGYEGDWPTYRRLKTHRPWPHRSTDVKSLVTRRAGFEEWPELLREYAWQWGVLWDKGLPWLSREAFGFAEADELDAFLPSLTKRAKEDRKAIAVVSEFSHGQRLIDAWQEALLSSRSLDAEACFALIRNSAISLQFLVERHGVSYARELVDQVSVAPAEIPKQYLTQQPQHLTIKRSSIRLPDSEAALNFEG
jgi:hypothetical protein